MRGAQVLRLPEQEGTWEELGKHWAPAPSPSQKSRHPRMRELKMGLASNGGTSPLHSGYWCHSQRDRWETGKWLQWRGGGKEDESPAWGREAVWTCQLHTGNLSEYASVTWLMQWVREQSEASTFAGFNSICSGRQRGNSRDKRSIEIRIALGVRTPTIETL